MECFSGRPCSPVAVRLVLTGTWCSCLCAVDQVWDVRGTDRNQACPCFPRVCGAGVRWVAGGSDDSVPLRHEGKAISCRPKLHGQLPASPHHLHPVYACAVCCALCAVCCCCALCAVCCVLWPGRKVGAPHHIAQVVPAGQVSLALPGDSPHPDFLWRVPVTAKHAIGPRPFTRAGARRHKDRREMRMPTH